MFYKSTHGPKNISKRTVLHEQASVIVFSISKKERKKERSMETGRLKLFMIVLKPG
jgi:hypothetical protein